MTNLWNKDKQRKLWPKRAVVTTGTPYGNKPLHFGHIGGVFVPADAFARFLRDRIGKDNILFVGGTDCFGSPINEGYRKEVENNNFSGTIADYVQKNHDLQAETLSQFNISLDIFEGSNIGKSAEVHQELSNSILEALYDSGTLKLESTNQFFDEKANTFLNGRQVVGYCPVQGCKSSKAYADECELGHQFAPEDLIKPTSTLTGTTPIMKKVENWYFDLPSFRDFLKKYCNELTNNQLIRPVVPTTISEFLADPIIYIKNEFYDEYLQIKDKLPQHIFKEAKESKSSFELNFNNVYERDEAKKILDHFNIRFRTGKTLVPFRLTGNIEWGVSAPTIEGKKGLTIWCWPESLWQPISFSIALLEKNKSEYRWTDFWCDDDSVVYQFLGQDNLYFYGVAQTAMFEVLSHSNILSNDNCGLKQTRLIANHHLLFGKDKASSSGEVKPPTGEELLEYYTVEQLRCHFLALGLDSKAVAFSPKPFNPALSEEQKKDNRIADPVLKEAALLNNIFNRLARSCFYEAQKSFNCTIPKCEIDIDLIEKAHITLNDYSKKMMKVELHSALSIAEEFIRFSQKYWADGAKVLNDENGSKEMRARHLCNCIYLTWISTLMMHPIVPEGCEKICDFFNCNQESFFSWDHDFVSLDELFVGTEFQVQELPNKFDFFKKHQSQFMK